jgi:acyl-CoA reductase-like NAD-dependent aldehyde dehydrogenase
VHSFVATSFQKVLAENFRARTIGIPSHQQIEKAPACMQSEALSEALREANAIREALREALSEEIREAIREAINKEIREALREAIREALREAINKEIREALREAINKEIREALRFGRRPRCTYGGGVAISMQSEVIRVTRLYLWRRCDTWAGSSTAYRRCPG